MLLRMRTKGSDDEPQQEHGSHSRSRRLLVQRVAVGTLTVVVGEWIVPFRPTPLAVPSAAATEALSRVYDLGLDSVYNRAPGKLVVLPPGAVEKSPADDKMYRALTLANGLRVLLVSDQKADTAAAALNVRVGHFSDPDSLPGLAHLCEHLLFLGTQKFPREGELETFLGRNGGRSNAFTANEETCFHFTVNAGALQGALDIFAQFFIAPLFSASCFERELSAVNSEHDKNLNTDSWRIGQALKLRYNQRHPLAKFGTGNIETLARIPRARGEDVRAQVP